MVESGLLAGKGGAVLDVGLEPFKQDFCSCQVSRVDPAH